MSTPQTDRTRKAILEATRRLIEHTGPEQWTMESVADEAGVTRMTVYRHFPSRIELLVATVRFVDAREGAPELFATVAESTSGREALEMWSRNWFDYIPRIAPVARALLAARDMDEAAAKAWEDRMSALREWPRAIADRLEDEGQLAPGLDAEDAADLIWAIASVQVWDALVNGRSWPPAKYRLQLAGLLRRGITRPPDLEG